MGTAPSDPTFENTRRQNLSYFVCMYILFIRIKLCVLCLEKWTKHKSQYDILSEKIVILMKLCVYVRVLGGENHDCVKAGIIKTLDTKNPENN